MPRKLREKQQQHCCLRQLSCQNKMISITNQVFGGSFQLFVFPDYLSTTIFRNIIQFRPQGF